MLETSFLALWFFCFFLFACMHERPDSQSDKRGSRHTDAEPEHELDEAPVSGPQPDSRFFLMLPVCPSSGL